MESDLNNMVPRANAQTIAGLYVRLCAYLLDFILLLTGWALFGFDSLVLPLFLIIVSTLEASTLQASPGKWLMGVRVVPLYDGQAIASIKRNIAKICSHVFFLGFAVALGSKERRTFHDRMAGTLVCVREGLEIGPGRRAVAVSLITVAVSILVTAVTFHKVTSYFDKHGVFGFIVNGKKQELAPELASELLRVNFGIHLPASYRVERTQQWYDGFEKRTLIVAAQSDSSRLTSELSVAKLWGASAAGNRLVIYISEGPSNKFAETIKAELRQYSDKQQTVLHSVGDVSVQSIRYSSTQFGEDEVLAYFSFLRPEVVLLGLGRKDSFSLDAYLQMTMASQP